MRQRILASALLALVLSAFGAGAALAHPSNEHTLTFELTCDDGHVWDAAFNGGPSAFHLDGSSLFIWKQIAFVTPSRWHGDPVARLAFLHPETTLDIVDEVLDSTR